ncbi:alpha-ketoacid dehydrogenase subunit alpha/beta [Thermocatellispora tengchongensis]|uniref:alpha-ketoacid dehydrogenase subunit alpha/beta n=1 Tax=Thermocatellispora tengchongensis TaxID=1073253 RepID=UPI00364358F6
MCSVPRKPGSGMDLLLRWVGWGRRPQRAAAPLDTLRPQIPLSRAVFRGYVLRLDPIVRRLRVSDAANGASAAIDGGEEADATKTTFGGNSPMGAPQRDQVRLAGGRPCPAERHAGATAPHPGLRGDRARTRVAGPGPRARAFEHRAGGRGRRLGHRAADLRCDQRLAPQPPPVPRQGPHPPDGRQGRPRGTGPRRRAHAAAPHAGRDPRSRPGLQQGRGGSIHLQWLEAGALGSNAIVGGGVPLAAGNAWAQRRAGTDDITVTYFGDGAVNIGGVLESMNLAAAWDLPLCLFIENNLYAVATRVGEVTREDRLSARGLGFGIPSWKVDGMDPLAVHLATRQAEEIMRAGDGPVIIEADVYRYFHQNGAYAGSAFGYRTKDEEAEWRLRDPIVKLEREMRDLGLLDEATARGVREQAQEAMRQVTGELVEPDPEAGGKRRIRPELWPDPATVDDGLRGDAGALAGARTLDPAAYDGPRKTVRFIDAASDVLGRRMAADPRVIVLGEDVHRLGGGTNGVTKKALQVAPDRVLGTPISENAFAGLGAGMALDGRFRPVIEFMYPDFLWVAADQVFNQIGKARHMFGGHNNVPLVLRTKVAMGTGYGSQHLMDPAGIFATSPGWRIVAPSTASDYIGLFNTAMLLEDPVLVIEHVDLYRARQEVPEDDLDYCLPLGRAALRRTGSELTVISYLSMVHRAAEAIDEAGVDADLIDLRWLDRASIDWDTIGASVRKTNGVLIVEQGARGTSYGGGSPTRSSAATSTGSTCRWNGSPAPRRARASPASSKPPRSRRWTTSSRP